MLAGMSRAVLQWDLQTLVPIPRDDPPSYVGAALSPEGWVTPAGMLKGSQREESK